MKKIKKNESGIALFMVLGAVALLSVLVTELTYSTQMGSRLAYNAYDNARAYYLGMAGLKFSLVRISAYATAKKFLNDPKNKTIKGASGNIVEKIWDFPLSYPPVIPKDAPATISDPIKEFLNASALAGHYSALITSESSKLNLNNLFVKEGKKNSLNQNRPNKNEPNKNENEKQSTPSQTDSNPNSVNGNVDFKPMIENTIASLLNQKMATDEEFASIYRNISAKDILDAMEAYLNRNSQGSSLPGFRPINPKEAPFYSLSELHLIPGIDDGIFNLLSGSFTVISTSGININRISKETLWGLLYEFSEKNIDDLLLKRDDKDVGKPWSDESEFWADVEKVSGGTSIVNSIKDRLRSGGLSIVTDEGTFRLDLEATVGQSTRRFEAYIVINEEKKTNVNPPGANDIAPNLPTNPQNEEKINAPGKSSDSLVQLVYWRS